MTQNLRQCQK